MQSTDMKRAQEEDVVAKMIRIHCRGKRYVPIVTHCVRMRMHISTSVR